MRRSSANRCQPLIFVANTTCDDVDAEDGSNVTVQCIKGHRFPHDHDRSKVITCLNLAWSPVLAGCIRMCRQSPLNPSNVDTANFLLIIIL